MVSITQVLGLKEFCDIFLSLLFINTKFIQIPLWPNQVDSSQEVIYNHKLSQSISCIVIAYLCIKMEQFTIFSSPLSLTIEIYNWFDRVQIYELAFRPYSWSKGITGRSSPLNTKHAIKPRELKSQIITNIHKKQ